MKQIRLTKEDNKIENVLIQGEYVDIDQTEFKKINSIIGLKKELRVIASERRERSNLVF